MEFVEMKESAERWLGEHNSKFKLTAADENENRLIFSTPDTKTSFNITCPNKGEAWSVCSENENVLKKLQDTMEYLDSKEGLTVDMVLTRISKSLTDLSGGETEQACNGRGADKSDDEDDVDEFEDEEDDSDGYYYGDIDPDVEEPKKDEEKEEEDLDTHTFFAAQGATPSSVQRLTKDLKSISKQGDKYGFTAGPRGNNLFKWDVKMINIPEDSNLGRDLKKYAHKYNREECIEMEMQFPGDYPFSPPFLRVLRPRFKFLTGHVTIGGSICMEMLTKSGWRPCNDIEGILVQVRSEILSDPKASLHQTLADSLYTEAEAKDAFQRMVERYGWK
ncbi:ubiquitin-conjugating enzyme E2 Q1-like [Littorina saxatilis]|uniref:UBC core domain-containing protein n=1 Tax=Littorina saxatilis TaxID=31220 RepID=A0AAN9C1T9_9CAEN